MSDISPSSIRTDAALEESLKNASTPDEMKAILADAAVRQGLVTRDYYDPSVLIPADRTAAPKTFAKSITVEGGKKLFFEGDDEADVERRISTYLQSQMRPVETKPEVQPRDAKVQFTRVDDPVAKAELELQFKRGELTTADYLAQSGAIDEYFAAQGVSIDELKASVEQKRNENVEHSWKSVTQEFLNSPAGSDWPGGPENLKAIGEVLTAMHVENEPSVENLAAAYKYLKDHDQIAENPELVRITKISEAKSFSEVQEALGSHGSLFGR
jgi:hypothetical protein